MSAIQEWSLDRTVCGYSVPSLPDQSWTEGALSADPCGKPIYKWIYLPRYPPDKPYATVVCEGHWHLMYDARNGLGFQSQLDENQVFDTKNELIAYAILNG